MAQYEPTAPPPTRRHDRTQMNVRRRISDLVKRYGPENGALLEIGAFTAWHTVAYRDQLKSPRRTMIYDHTDYRLPKVKETTEFRKVDLEADRLPDADGAYEVVICNQVLEHLKNIYRPMSEIHRVLAPGGHLIISVPNLAAPHNCALLCLGRQPSTTAIMGSHVRGYAFRSFARFLEFNHHFRIVEAHGYGLHPFCSCELPGCLRLYCHTPLWLLRKTVSTLPLWDAARQSQFTTTNF